jgi:competence protein ComEC
VVGLFAVAVVGAWMAPYTSMLVIVVAAAFGGVALWWGVIVPPMRIAAAIALWVVVGGLAAHDQRALEDIPMGAWTGVATLRTDPDRLGRSVRAVLELDGWRYEAWARGIGARSLERRLAGEHIVVVGTRRPLQGVRRSTLMTRHVVGRVEVEHVAGAGAGAAATRAANRVHRVIGDIGSTWSPDRGALLSGLVLGNDRALSEPALAAFRRSGLAHLTAVSGQNVALLLSLVSPLLMRTGRRTRFVLTVAVVAWFAVLTRFEPSVLRASTMALLGASAAVLGRDRRPIRLVALAGMVLLLVDPFLVRSVSFWLSMSATSGLILATPSIARVFDARRRARPAQGTRPVVAAFSTTAGAQIGVLGVSTAVFGLPSSISLITNLLAVAPAGLVMTSGPVLAAVGAWSPEVAQWCARPVEALVWWIETVAQWGNRLAPPTPVDVMVWVTVIGVTVWGSWRRRRAR